MPTQTWGQLVWSTGSATRVICPPIHILPHPPRVSPSVDAGGWVCLVLLCQVLILMQYVQGAQGEGLSCVLRSAEQSGEPTEF